jgi:hypothetical protein
MMPDTRRRDDDTVPLIWRSLALRLVLAALPLWLTTFVLISNVGWPTKMVIALALAVSLAAPAHGLLLIAIVAPLGQLIAPLIGATNFRISEAVVLAFLAGWLLRASPDRQGPRLPAGALGWLLAAAIVAPACSIRSRTCISSSAIGLASSTAPGCSKASAWPRRPSCCSGSIRRCRGRCRPRWRHPRRWRHCRASSSGAVSDRRRRWNDSA